MRRDDTRYLWEQSIFASYADFFELFVNFQDLNLVAEFGPAALRVGIFLGGSAGFFRLPVAQQDVMFFAVAIEKIAAVAFGGENRDQLVDGFERRGFHFRHWLPHRDRKDF